METDQSLDLLRRVKYPNLTDDEWSYFLCICDQKGIEPLSEMLVPVPSFDERRGRGDLKIIATIDALRLLAVRTRRYRGPVGPSWFDKSGAAFDVWPHPYPPLAAQVGVIRKGFRETVWGKALFDSYCQYEDDRGKRVPTWYWLLHGANAIAKCAEALAIRRAFPEVTHGLYLREELARTHDIQLGAPADVQPSPEKFPGVELDRLGWNPMKPESRAQCGLALAFAGLSDGKAREDLIDNFRAMYPELHRQDHRGFYGTIMLAVMNDPSKYGIQQPAVA